MTTQLTWIQAPQPTERGEKWEWPAAFYTGPALRQAAYIICEEEFTPLKAKTGAHSQLAVVIRKYNDLRDREMKGFRNLADNRFKTVREATEFVAYWLGKNPDWMPKIQ